jgi:hypothetical protein
VRATGERMCQETALETSLNMLRSISLSFWSLSSIVTHFDMMVTLSNAA